MPRRKVDSFDPRLIELLLLAAQGRAIPPLEFATPELAFRFKNQLFQLRKLAQKEGRFPPEVSDRLARVTFHQDFEMVAGLTPAGGLARKKVPRWTGTSITIQLADTPYLGEVDRVLALARGSELEPPTPDLNFEKED